MTWSGPWSASPREIMQGMGLRPVQLATTRVAAAPKREPTTVRATSKVTDSSKLPPPPTVVRHATSTPAPRPTTATRTAPAKR